MLQNIGVCQCLLTRGTRVTTYNVGIVRQLSIKPICNAKIFFEKKLQDKDVPEIVQYARDKNILYSSYISRRKVKLRYTSKQNLKKKLLEEDFETRRDQAVPLIIEQILSKTGAQYEDDSGTISEETSPRFNFPYSSVDTINMDDLKLNTNIEKENLEWGNQYVQEDVTRRMQAYDEGLLEPIELTNTSLADENLIEDFSRGHVFEGSDSDVDEDPMECGTCDPNVPVSKVPCGGCGAYLHCQEYALPGFVPKELFEGRNRGELRNLTCQRCYFLKHHNVALNVRVSPDVYQKLLEPIKNERALVIIVVDVLDVPCSIWPGLLDIIGTRRPVVIVGNKVDLLPSDGSNHLRRVKESLTAAVDSTALGRANIKHIALVSAHTGFGIESLITKVQNSWGTKGNVYIVGCTNSGKSTLFNALLGSDMCKTRASELILRATTSPWPGTTLNMLKFPLLRPSGYRLYLRVKRLQQMQKQDHLLEKTKQRYADNVAVATLSGHIGRTFATAEPDEISDPFTAKANAIPKESDKVMGINELNPYYSDGKWCYDTPGTVQPDQMINLLSHEELMKVLPRELILPRTYSLTSGKTVFIGGLARLDLVYSPSSVRFTVFAGADLPITIVKTVEASAFYRNYLGTSLLGVPMGGEERLQYWPVLKPCDFRMDSMGNKECCADVVLSSAGWIAVTGTRDHVIEVRGWTPGGRGLYLRNPPILPRIITLKGRRLEKSPAYRPHKFLVPKPDV